VVWEKQSSGVRIRAAALACALLASACLNPNTYSTPRTTPVGQVQNTAALEVISFSDSRYEGDSIKSVYAQTSLVAPTYALRVGASDSVDIGARIGNGSALGVDLKWNFFKSKFFDMAGAPGLQTFYVSKGAGGRSGGAHFYGNLPLMLGINPSDRFSIVPSVGLGYGFGRRAAADDDALERVASTKALLLQAGIGLDFRISPTFAIHPEMSLLRRVLAPDDTDLIWFTFGLGFDWGALPRYESAP
jgi:hypothetical protein